MLCFYFREQQTSKDLDIVTGFQVMDGIRHMFVLEGLRDKCIHDLWQALPQPENAGEIWRRVVLEKERTFIRCLFQYLNFSLFQLELVETILYPSKCVYPLSFNWRLLVDMFSGASVFQNWGNWTLYIKAIHPRLFSQNWYFITSNKVSITSCRCLCRR